MKMKYMAMVLVISLLFLSISLTSVQSGCSGKPIGNATKKVKNITIPPTESNMIPIYCHDMRVAGCKTWDPAKIRNRNGDLLEKRQQIDNDFIIWKEDTYIRVFAGESITFVNLDTMRKKGTVVVRFNNILDDPVEIYTFMKGSDPKTVYFNQDGFLVFKEGDRATEYNAIYLELCPDHDGDGFDVCPTFYGGDARPRDCNDNDGQIYPGAIDIPRNGIDEDCSGFDEEFQCNDGFDNDNDGFIDMNDLGCDDIFDDSEGDDTSACQDGIDNDGDGFTDYPDDPGCYSRYDKSELSSGNDCDDGLDNDGDGLVDFPDDPGCYNSMDPVESNPGIECDDGTDNDGDGLIDTEDPDCSSSTDDSEDGMVIYTLCSDSIDNDGDGFTDFPEDKGCSGPSDDNERTECQDGLDNDGDGKADLLDNGCFGVQDESETNAAYLCDDGRDNDGDGFIDYPDDMGCASHQDNTERTDCQDGIDNDGDGYVDMQDPACFGIQATSEKTMSRACDDGRDNDGDGLVDYPDDPGCYSVFDTSENDPYVALDACSDNIDNDGDGYIDYPEDPGCFGTNDNDEYNILRQCDDGRDNDGDGLVDYPDDPGCNSLEDNNEYNAQSLSLHVCEDGIDNDGDGLTDYPDDPGCSDLFDGSEANTFSLCNDGIDNDYDGYIDYPNDFGCSSPASNNERTDCQDGIDNDGDGKTDTSDSGCFGSQDSSELNTDYACDDGEDNDGDGYSDYPMDKGCYSSRDNSELNNYVQCDDGLDNDGDGLIDYLDPGCTGPTDTSEQNSVSPGPDPPGPVPPTGNACNDGLDNDNDGFIDYPDDAGCSSYSGLTELTDCQDGRDNDGDGLPDDNDPGCYGFQDTSENNKNVECDDGIDNDWDGKRDYPSDSDCDSPFDNTESGSDNGGNGDDSDNPTAYAYASSTSGDEPHKVYFTGDVEGGDAPYTYRWTFGDGSSSSSMDTSHTYRDTGTFTVIFKVTDDDGDTDTDTVTIRVHEDDDDDDDLRANAYASPSSGDLPLKVYFRSDVDGGDSPYDYRWTFGDGSISYGNDPSHTYRDPGTYRVTLRVTDDDGNTDTDRITVRVYEDGYYDDNGYDNDYVPRVYVYANPYSGNEPLRVTFTGDVVGGDFPHSYRWTFGDGTTSYTKNPTHVFRNEGVYTVTLRVTDEDRDTGTDTATIRVYSSDGHDDNSGGDTNDGDRDDPAPSPPNGDIEETSVSLKPAFLNTFAYHPVTGKIFIKTEDPDTFRISIEGISDEWMQFPERVYVEDEKTVYYTINPKTSGDFRLNVRVASSAENYEFEPRLWVGRNGGATSTGSQGHDETGTGKDPGLTGFFTYYESATPILISALVIIAAIVAVFIGYKYFREESDEDYLIGI